MKYEGGTDVFFDDLKIEITDKPVAMVVQENHYYPFGLGMKGLDYVAPSPNVENKFTFNGKEKQTELGLNHYDFSARSYDVQIGRTTTLDPHGDSYPNMSGYSFLNNNPLITIDPTGMDGYKYNWNTGQYENSNGEVVNWYEVQGNMQGQGSITTIYDKKQGQMSKDAGDKLRNQLTKWVNTPLPTDGTNGTADNRLDWSTASQEEIVDRIFHALVRITIGTTSKLIDLEGLFRNIGDLPTSDSPIRGVVGNDNVSISFKGLFTTKTPLTGGEKLGKGSKSEIPPLTRSISYDYTLTFGSLSMHILGGSVMMTPYAGTKAPGGDGRYFGIFFQNVIQNRQYLIQNFGNDALRKTYRLWLANPILKNPNQIHP
jgi:RHS repeat-associated protein